MKRKILFLLMAVSLSQVTVTLAKAPPEEVSLLKQQIKLLTERLDKLEESAKQVSTTGINKISKKQSKTSLADRISFKANFRQRYEIIDQEGREERDRHRLRLRAAMKMKIDDSLSFTLGVATGGDSPVSTNQALDTGFSTKDIRLALAHFDYKFSGDLNLTGGKMKNPFYRPGGTLALWDGDLNPEGFALKFNRDSTKGTLVGFSVEERSSNSDSYMLGGQITHDFKISDSSTLVAGVGYYNYSNLKGFEPLYDSRSRGNSIDANGNYLTDFNIAEFLVEYKTKLADQPLSFFGNIHKNTAADDLGRSIAYGINYGKIKDSGSWKIELSYIDNEADSVIALFNDSDFGGGNTDTKGFILRYGHGIKKNLWFRLSYINSEFGQSQNVQTDYKRLLLDLNMKFQ